tara:strand:- start:1934 stop:2722 length:789 start_codon:yes stop_codon:yes gene_type:complete
MSEFEQFALDLADASGSVIRKYFRKDLNFEDKLDNSPVTVADRLAETVIRNMINEKYPSHDILGEELGFQNTGSKWKWVIDPIDGTRSFVSGMPIFGTLISLLENGSPKIGIIDIPILYERWFSESGEDCFFYPSAADQKKIICKVSGKKNIEQAILYSADPRMFNSSQKPLYDRVSSQVKLPRFGGDCYSYGLLASGYIDLVIEADMKIYDLMALVPVIESAEGIISDWQGNTAFDNNWDGCVVASSSEELHMQTISLLKE